MLTIYRLQNQIPSYFLLENVRILCIAKDSHILSTKNNSVFVIFMFEILTNRYLITMPLVLNTWALISCIAPAVQHEGRTPLAYILYACVRPSIGKNGPTFCKL